MALVEQTRNLPMVIGRYSGNLTRRSLPKPQQLGEINPVSTGISVAQSVASTIASTVSSSTVVGVNVGGGVVIGLTGAVFAVAGVVLAVAAVVYSLVSAHQAKVRANRIARRARWEALHQTGLVLIQDAYGPVSKYFKWSTAHSPDLGFGEYYQLGAMFYYWRSQAGAENVPNKSKEEFRVDLINFLRGHGLDPTRMLGRENVKKDEDLDMKSGNVAMPEKVLTMREILQSIGYSDQDLNKVPNDEIFRYFFDTLQIDLPRAKTELDATIIMRDVNAYFSMAGLNPAIFFNKVNKGSLVGATGQTSTVAAQPTQVLTSDVEQGVPIAEPLPVPTGAAILPTGKLSLQAGMSPMMWILLIGGGMFMLFGGKSVGRKRRS